MDIHELKNDLIQYSRTIGIDKIGFTTSSPFDELKNRLIRQQELHYQSGFEEPDIDKRTKSKSFDWMGLNPLFQLPLLTLLK